MDATDQAAIAGDHQLHEGLAEGTAVRRKLVFRPYRPCSDRLLVVAGNCPTGKQDLGCRCQLCLCLVCIGYGHMVGNAVARELMAGRHHRVDCRVQPGHLHRRNRVYCPSVGPMNRPLGRRPVALLPQALRMLDWPADLAIDDMPGPRDEVRRHRLGEKAVCGHDKYGSRRSTPPPQATVQSLSAKTPASKASARSKSQDVGADANVTQDSSDSTLRHAGAHCTTRRMANAVGGCCQPTGHAWPFHGAGSRPRLRRDHTAANGSGP